MGWSFKSRLREYGIDSKDVPIVMIDLRKTFVDQPHFETEFAVFFYLNGKEVRHSWRIWKLGWDAYNELAIEWAKEDTRFDQASVCRYLEKVFRSLEKSRELLIPELRVGDGMLISHEKGVGVDEELFRSRLLIDYLMWVVDERFAFSVLKEMRTETKKLMAVMSLYALNDLIYGEELFSRYPELLVDIYADARDILGGGRLMVGHHDTVLASAKKAASARHSEHRELKLEALDYYAKHLHRFRSRATAASEIARLIPIKERTIYKWLTAYDRANGS